MKINCINNCAFNLNITSLSDEQFNRNNDTNTNVHTYICFSCRETRNVYDE